MAPPVPLPAPPCRASFPVLCGPPSQLLECHTHRAGSFPSCSLPPAYTSHRAWHVVGAQLTFADCVHSDESQAPAAGLRGHSRKGACCAVQRWRRERAGGPGVRSPPDQGPGFLMWRWAPPWDRGAHQWTGLCGALDAAAARGASPGRAFSYAGEGGAAPLGLLSGPSVPAL